MSSVAGVSVRQSTELITSRLQSRNLPQTLGFLGVLIIIFTALGFCLAIFLVDYICAQVIATLAAVEDSNPTTYIRLDSEDSIDSSESNDAEVADISGTKPITRGLRPAINHLRARGRIWSCCHGFRMYLAFTGLDMGVANLISIAIHHLLRSIAGSGLGSSLLGDFIASMFLATWQMAWVHLVIADKSPRSSYRRMLGLRHWSRIAPAAAMYNLLMCTIFFLPRAFSGPLHWNIGAVIVTILVQGKTEGLLEFLVMRVAAGLLFPLVSFPAKAIFIRVAASMLPEEDDPIVPFDRLFGGKAKPESIGGPSKLSLKDAWATFKWDARIRYIKVILKALAIKSALFVVGFVLVVGEVWFCTSVLS